MMKRAALYARVGTRDGHQKPEVQYMALRQVADAPVGGWLRSMSITVSVRAERKGHLAIARDLRVGVSTVRRELGAGAP